MKLIIPMAGRGTRVRPHSHTVPKPLLPVAGKMIVERIVETFARTLDREIDEIVFILGPDFGQDIKDALKAMSDRQDAEARFRVQRQAEGTAHAVYCAEEDLSGECIIVFADTIFDMEGSVSIEDADSVVWLKEVEDPSRFGVAVEKEGKITDFVEKPEEPISNLAIIGVYYFKEAAQLKKEIEYLLDNNIRGKAVSISLPMRLIACSRTIRCSARLRLTSGWIAVRCRPGAKRRVLLPRRSMKKLMKTASLIPRSFRRCILGMMWSSKTVLWVRMPVLQRDQHSPNAPLKTA